MNKKIKIAVCAVLAVAVLAGSIGTGIYVNKNSQKAIAEGSLSISQRQVLTQSFDSISTGKKAALKRTINNENPLNLVNYYGDEPISDLWNSIPDKQKPYTVLLLIPGHTLRSGDEKALNELNKNVAICEKSKIPYAIQVINGEIAPEETLPVSYIEKSFAENHQYFYGINAAEMYNGVQWRGETESNNSGYLINLIKLCAKYGAYFIWTDTNINYKNGMILQWLESNEQFYSTFKEYSDYICMLNKESISDPSTYSVMEGLWLAGLIGNWGVSSDWWHWQCDADKSSLFGEYDQYVDNEWDMIMNYPENMYVQSMMLVMSAGGTCFKAEAPNFSTSYGGHQYGGFRYGISPLLDRVINKKIAIPTREQVLQDTKAAVIGQENYNTFNYNFDNSNLYPEDGSYKIIPLLPNNIRSGEIKIFNNNDIALIDTNADKKTLSNYYEAVNSDTYLTRTGDQWYFINNSENKRINKKGNFVPVICSAKNVSIEAAEHTSAIIQEKTDGLYFYISNYRTNKENMIKKITPSDFDNKKWAQICGDYLTLDSHGNPIGVDDSELRTTTITITGAKDGEEPKLTFSMPKSGKGYQNRKYTYDKEWDKQSGTLTVTIQHNGIVEMSCSLDKSDSKLDAKKAVHTKGISANNNSTSNLQAIYSSLKIDEKAIYNPYSLLAFNAAKEKANVVINEMTYSKKQIRQAEKELQSAYDNLLDITKYVEALKSKDVSKLTDPQGKAYDALLKEITSNLPYVSGRTNTLEYSKLYKNSKFNKAKKEKALSEKYQAFKSEF